MFTSSYPFPSVRFRPRKVHNLLSKWNLPKTMMKMLWSVESITHLNHKSNGIMMISTSQSQYKRKQKISHVGTWHYFSFFTLYSVFSSAHDIIPTTFKIYLPCPVKSPWKIGIHLEICFLGDYEYIQDDNKIIHYISLFSWLPSIFSSGIMIML